jgi:zinc protease
MQREELVKFHETWFRPNNATMVIVGDTTLAEITPKLEKLFGGWSRGETPHKNIGTVALASKPVLYLIDKPGAPQSVIFAGQIAPPRNNPREIAIEVMNNVLGGTFSSRINMNLREDKHWSYGAQSVFFGARGQRPFFALAPVQSDKTKESVAEMDKEMRGIIGPKPAAGTELANTRNNMALRLPGSRESVNEVGESMLDIVQYGLPDDYYDTYVQKVRAVSESEIADAAKSTIHPDRLTWIVVGDRAKVEPGLRELGIAEIRLIDAEGKPQ